jgi:hypothetical protein
MRRPEIQSLFDHLVGSGEEGSAAAQGQARAVFMLMTSSKVVGCSNGSSAGFARLRMRSTKNAARRDRSISQPRGSTGAWCNRQPHAECRTARSLICRGYLSCVRFHNRPGDR